jgi:hydroxyethylthiazole kinase-like uncharacterized protein yjeF
MKLVTVEEMQKIEKEANQSGHSYDDMMEFAGSGLAETVMEEFFDLQEEGVMGLVGSGNNGGDTLVALAHMAGRGWQASAYIVRPREKEDPLVERLEQAGGEIFRMESDDKEYSQLVELLEDHGVLLDGVLGTGIHLPLRGKLADCLGFVKHKLEEMEFPPQVVAVDCPSGVDTDSGEAALETIPADLTVTMAAVKVGLLKFPAADLAGELHVVGIGLPDNGAGLDSWQAVKRIVPDAAWVSGVLPERPSESHKGTFGTALIVAGSLNYTGAVLLSGKAAYRSGTGLVTVGLPTPLHAAVAGLLPEATWLLLPHEMGVISQNAVDVLFDHLDRATAMLFGPGFGTEDTTKEFIARLIGANPRHHRANIGFVTGSAEKEAAEPAELPPLVIDADGLKLLSSIENWWQYLPAPAVLTPHPGEMSVITGLSIQDIQQDRMATATRFSEKWGHVVVLKGAFSVVASPDGRSAVIPVASPSLASAGSGDVLAGLITGLRAQGVPAFEAAVAGGWIHGQAGLLAGHYLGSSAPVLAGDILEAIVDVMAEL